MITTENDQSKKRDYFGKWFVNWKKKSYLQVVPRSFLYLDDDFKPGNAVNVANHAS